MVFSVQIDWATASDALSERRGHRTRLRVFAGAACALVVGLIVLRTNLEVVREGDIFGYGTVQEVELFGRFTFYTDAERPTQMDILTGFLLVAAASTSFFAGLVLSAWARIDRRLVFFLVAALGATFLAADEALGIHETLGANLRFLAQLPGVRHPDDAVYAAYLLPASVFVYRFRTIIASSRRALGLFVIGCSLYVLGAVMEVKGGLGLEEYVEALASLVLLACFVTLGLSAVSATRAEHIS
jgi:hypothetical protein